MHDRPIALVNICNPEDITVPPLSLLYLGHELKKEGYAVKIFHFKNIEIEEQVEKVIRLNPLYVGVSVFTGNKTKDSATFSKKIKQRSSVAVAWGGIHPTLLPHQCINEWYIDFVMHGEGERTIIEFTKEFDKAGKKDYSKILGLGYKDERNRGIVNPPRPMIENLDELKIDWELMDIKKFFEQQWGSRRILGFISSRGCPFNCGFCYNQAFNNRRWRAHSADKVVQEVTYLKDNYNIDGIKFYDDLFFSNPKRAIDILERIKLPWYGEVRIGMVTPHMVDKCIKTEAKEILFGLESGSDRILKLMNKQQNVKQIYDGVKMLAKAPELRVVGSFIVGCPTETKEETFETVDMILNLQKIHPSMRYSVGFYLPYPGSEMYTMAVQLGFKPPEKTEDWDQLDRWANKLTLSWLTWTQDSDYFMRIRDYTNLLPLKDVHIPILKNLPEKRLKEKDFYHDAELKTLKNLQQKFAMQGTAFRKFGWAILPYIRKNYKNPEIQDQPSTSSMQQIAPVASTASMPPE